MNILLSRKGIDTATLYATMDRQAALEDTENLAGSDKQCPFQSVIPNPTTRRGLVSGIFAFWKHLRPLAPKQLLCQVLSDEHTQYKTHLEVGVVFRGGSSLQLVQAPLLSLLATLALLSSWIRELLFFCLCLLLFLCQHVTLFKTTTETRSLVQLRACDSDSKDRPDLLCVVLVADKAPCQQS